MANETDQDIPRFLSEDVCRAAQIDAVTLRNWISRDPPAITLREHDRKALRSGKPHLFTYRRVLQVALTADLVRLGFAPRKAGMMAAGFTEVGDVTIPKGGADREEAERLPGELYPDGLTFLIAYPEDDVSYIQRVGPKTSLLEVLHLSGEGLRASAAIVNVTQIDMYARAVLGMRAR
jgi:hypothetical protein